MALSKEDLEAIRHITTEVTEEVTSQQIEELAVLIGKSFQKVETRFEGMGQQFHSLEKRLDEHGQQMANIKLTLTDHSLLLHRIDRRTHDQQRLDQHEIRLRRLEKHQELRPLPGTVDG